MAQWRNVSWAVVKGILQWLDVFLAWNYFLSRHASVTVAAVIATHIISRCCGYLFDVVNQAPDEFSFSNPGHLWHFARQLLEIANLLWSSTSMAIIVGIITTFFPRDVMEKMALSYMIGFCARLYYLFCVGPQSEGEVHGGGNDNGGNDSLPHNPQKKRKAAQGKGKKKKNKKRNN